MVLVFILLFNIMYAFFLMRVRLCHPELFLELGSPPAVWGSEDKFISVLKFLFSFRFMKHKDLALTLLSFIVAVLFLAVIAFSLYYTGWVFLHQWS